MILGNLDFTETARNFPLPKLPKNGGFWGRNFWSQKNLTRGIQQNLGCTTFFGPLWTHDLTIQLGHNTRTQFYYFHKIALFDVQILLPPALGKTNMAMKNKHHLKMNRCSFLLKNGWISSQSTLKGEISNIVPFHHSKMTFDFLSLNSIALEVWFCPEFFWGAISVAFVVA